MPNVSIVIVSYNCRSYLLACIRSILSQKDINCEIIVADNNSSDGTVEALAAEYPSVKVIRNGSNSGFSAANNQGIAAAQSNFILLLNPDTELMQERTLCEMFSYMQANPLTGILAPCLLNTDGTYQNSFWHFPRVSDILLEIFYLHHKTLKTLPAEPATIEAASGAALCFKKQLPGQIGGFDESLFWMEDVDFCYRAKKAGFNTVFHPGIKIIHHGGKSSEGQYAITIPNQVMSKLKFFKKHGSNLNYCAALCLTFIFVFSRLCVFGILSFTGKAVWRGKASAYAKTLKEFFRYLFLGRNGIIGNTDF
ncbi:MAG: glycosyltransferase family 2 protein [Bacteroidia bacterium]|nr:glycosyltransferase family 2 protein [Bacteroidia bacterium]